MESNYESKYSGEQVDAAVEYFLRHSQILEDNDYTFNRTIFCESTTVPAQPFNSSQLPIPFPSSFPIIGASDGKSWYEYPNTQSSNWYQCSLLINKATQKITQQGNVIPMTGNNGLNGQDGADGNNGADGPPGNDGSNGKDGNYVEYRYRRSTAWAIELTPAQKVARRPVGWELTTDTGNENEAGLYSLCDEAIERFLTKIAGDTPNLGNEWIKFSFSNYHDLDTQYYRYRGHRIKALESQQSIIMQVFGDFKDVATIDTDISQRNARYHSLYTQYIDAEHHWNLFMIYATISGETDQVIGEWSTPIKLTGNDGGMGPEGNPGVSGIPGVGIGIAYSSGTEDAIASTSVNPTSEEYRNSFSKLLAAGTGWHLDPSSCVTTEELPYLWYTQCRYYISTDENGEEIEVIEDPWSVPRRWTGLNGVTTIVTQPVIYPMGIYDVNTVYINDGRKAPYVFCPNEGDSTGNGDYYYLAKQGTWQGIINGTRHLSNYAASSEADDSHPWIKFEGFNAIMTKVAIIANGLVGSAVFNGDYMFSQRGIFRTSSNPGGVDTVSYINSSYKPSTHYEYFLKDYVTGAPVSSVTSYRNAFVPHFWINLSTGEFGSSTYDARIKDATDAASAVSGNYSSLSTRVTQLQSTVGTFQASVDDLTTELSNTESRITQKANSISATVTANMGTKLRQAGFEITPNGTTFRGSVSGDSDGTFKGDVKASSLAVTSGNVEIIKFVAYSSALGSPSNGATIPNGCPVMLVSHNGKTYINNLVELTSGTSVTFYVHNIEIDSIRTITSVNRTYGAQGTKNCYKIKTAPYLYTTDGVKVLAKLYDTNGTTELNWDDFLGKYYYTDVVEQMASPSGSVWKWKKKGNFANTTTYKGDPEPYVVGLQIGGNSSREFAEVPALMFKKITIVNGVIRADSNPTYIGVVEHHYKNGTSGALETGSSVAYLDTLRYSKMPVINYNDGTEFDVPVLLFRESTVTSASSAPTLTQSEINENQALVMPPIQI